MVSELSMSFSGLFWNRVRKQWELHCQSHSGNNRYSNNSTNHILKCRKQKPAPSHYSSCSVVYYSACCRYQKYISLELLRQQFRSAITAHKLYSLWARRLGPYSSKPRPPHRVFPLFCSLSARPALFFLIALRTPDVTLHIHMFLVCLLHQNEGRNFACPAGCLFPEPRSGLDIWWVLNGY